MATEVKCPNCGNVFPLEEAMTEEYKKELREQMQSFLKSKEKEFQKKEQDLLQHAQQQESTFLRKLEDEKRQIRQSKRPTAFPRASAIISSSCST